MQYIVVDNTTSDYPVFVEVSSQTGVVTGGRNKKAYQLNARAGRRV
jgi:hypothetical protein